MPTDLPIACSLTADELPARLAEMASIGRKALVSVEMQGTSAVLRFDADAATRSRLAAVVAAEARCCAFLTMTLVVESDTAVLTIEAPDGAEPILSDLVTAFRAERAA